MKGQEARGREREREAYVVAEVVEGNRLATTRAFYGWKGLVGHRKRTWRRGIELVRNVD